MGWDGGRVLVAKGSGGSDFLGAKMMKIFFGRGLLHIFRDSPPEVEIGIN